MGLKGLTILPVLFLSIIGLLFAGCSGGGSGSGPATALNIAERVSVVDAQSSTDEVMALKMGRLQLAPSDLPANSDYNNDETKVWVDERSVDAFNMVNEILCVMAQTQYDEMLNEGPYKAQIDLRQCSSERDSAESAGQESQDQSSGSDMPEYEMWTVDSSRADGDSPHIVKVWVRMSPGESYEGEPGKLIYAKATITEGASDANPYGIFALNFEGHHVDSNGEVSPTIRERGFLKTERDSTGKILVKFLVNGSDDMDGDGNYDETFSEKATLDRATDGSTGGGTISMAYSGPWGDESIEYDIAFNETHFFRSDGTTDVCLSRSEFDETAWRYGLYDSEGSRLTRSSGFPIKTVVNGRDYYGWIGYWGVWFPHEVSLSSGDTVYKLTYGNGGGTETPYTVLISGGKLKRHTKRTLTLGEIKNIPLDYNDNNTDYRVEWDGANFNITGQLNRDNWMWEDATGTIDLTALRYTTLGFWSRALGGNVDVKLDSCTYNDGTQRFSCSASDDSSVLSFAEDIVYPGDNIPAAFACFDRCPDAANITGADPFYAVDPYQNVAPSGSTYITYTFDTANMVLQDGGTDVVLASANSDHQWGIWSGPLFDPDADDDGDGTSNLDELACDWSPDETCAGNIRERLNVHYTWETGVEEWHKFTGLRDSNDNFLTFDAPLPVKYAHTGDGYTNATFYLEYGGFGELWGIPGKCVDMDTGADTECGPDTRWIPEFTISNGSVVIDGTDNTTEYLVKALEKEQRMQAVAESNCSSLSLANYDLPTMGEYTAPDIGDEPTVEGAPAVIGGVLQ